MNTKQSEKLPIISFINELKLPDRIAFVSVSHCLVSSSISFAVGVAPSPLRQCVPPSLGPIGSYGDTTDCKGFLNSEPYRVPLCITKGNNR